jgi:hypothetical protein
MLFAQKHIIKILVAGAAVCALALIALARFRGKKGKKLRAAHALACFLLSLALLSALIYWLGSTTDFYRLFS